ncbi:unnamed protein product [Ixodes pacificus]
MPVFLNCDVVSLNEVEFNVCRFATFLTHLVINACFTMEITSEKQKTRVTARPQVFRVE